MNRTEDTECSKEIPKIYRVYNLIAYSYKDITKKENLIFQNYLSQSEFENSMIKGSPKFGTYNRTI